MSKECGTVAANYRLTTQLKHQIPKGSPFMVLRLGWMWLSICLNGLVLATALLVKAAGRVFAILGFMVFAGLVRNTRGL